MVSAEHVEIGAAGGSGDCRRSFAALKFNAPRLAFASEAPSHGPASLEEPFDTEAISGGVNVFCLHRSVTQPTEPLDKQQAIFNSTAADAATRTVAPLKAQEHHRLSILHCVDETLVP